MKYSINFFFALPSFHISARPISRALYQEGRDDSPSVYFFCSLKLIIMSIPRVFLNPSVRDKAMPMVKLDPALTRKTMRGPNLYNPDHECHPTDIKRHLKSCSLQDDEALRAVWEACSSEDLDTILQLAKLVVSDVTSEQERRTRNDPVILAVAGHSTSAIKQTFSWTRRDPQFPDRKCVDERIQLTVSNPLVQGVLCLNPKTPHACSSDMSSLRPGFQGPEAIIYTEPFQALLKPIPTDSDYDADTDTSA